jgi:hypothetical protein
LPAGESLMRPDYGIPHYNLGLIWPIEEIWTAQSANSSKRYPVCPGRQKALVGSRKRDMLGFLLATNKNDRKVLLKLFQKADTWHT